MRSTRISKWLTAAITLLILVASAFQLVGMVLPGSHNVSSTITLSQPPEAVWAAISSPQAMMRWRADLDRVEARRSGESWTEFGRYGAVPMAFASREPPSRLVTEVASERAGFTGTWTWVLLPTDTGCQVTVTEALTLDNPGHRVMTRLLLGAHENIDPMLVDLGAHFGQDVKPTHVDR